MLSLFSVKLGLTLRKDWMSHSECQISVPSLRWPRTCTTCWQTTDTSWNVEVLSKWRGRERWPLTSSPAAPQVANERPFDRRVTPTALMRQRLQRDREWSARSATQAHWGQRKASRDETVCVLPRTQMHKWRVLFTLGGFLFSPSCPRDNEAQLP